MLQRIVCIAYAKHYGDGSWSWVQVVPPLPTDRPDSGYSSLALDGDWEDAVGSVVVLQQGTDYRWQVVTEEDE